MLKKRGETVGFPIVGLGSIFSRSLMRNFFWHPVMQMFYFIRFAVLAWAIWNNLNQVVFSNQGCSADRINKDHVRIGEKLIKTLI